MEHIYQIDDQITTDDGFTFVVVDIAEYDGETFYVVRADANGADASASVGIEGVDWCYVNVPSSGVMQ